MTNTSACSTGTSTHITTHTCLLWKASSKSPTCTLFRTFTYMTTLRHFGGLQASYPRVLYLSHACMTTRRHFLMNFIYDMHVWPHAGTSEGFKRLPLSATCVSSMPWIEILCRYHVCVCVCVHAWYYAGTMCVCVCVCVCVHAWYYAGIVCVCVCFCVRTFARLNEAW